MYLCQGENFPLSSRIAKYFLNFRVYAWRLISYRYLLRFSFFIFLNQTIITEVMVLIRVIRWRAEKRKRKKQRGNGRILAGVCAQSVNFMPWSTKHSTLATTKINATALVKFLTYPTTHADKLWTTIFWNFRLFNFLVWKDVFMGGWHICAYVSSRSKLNCKCQAPPDRTGATGPQTNGIV